MHVHPLHFKTFLSCHSRTLYTLLYQYSPKNSTNMECIDFIEELNFPKINYFGMEWHLLPVKFCWNDALWNIFAEEKSSKLRKLWSPTQEIKSRASWIQCKPDMNTLTLEKILHSLILSKFNLKIGKRSRSSSRSWHHYQWNELVRKTTHQYEYSVVNISEGVAL